MHIYVEPHAARENVTAEETRAIFKRHVLHNHNIYMYVHASCSVSLVEIGMFTHLAQLVNWALNFNFIFSFPFKYTRQYKLSRGWESLTF